MRKDKVEISDDLKAYCEAHIKNDCATCKLRQVCHEPCRMSYDALDNKITKMNRLVDIAINPLAYYA